MVLYQMVVIHVLEGDWIMSCLGRAVDEADKGTTSSAVYKRPLGLFLLKYKTTQPKPATTLLYSVTLPFNIYIYISMASSQADLRKIGLEGFALIDKFYGPSRANDAFPGRREAGFWVVHQVPNGEMEKPAVKAKEVVGIAVPNYPRGGKLQNRWGRPIKP
ncbi:hypothetical protein E2542_SST01310 [Spatholobus suberectus]|nr:hypothetical protein E2542_SST01310 [Spatholobus suberectus]